MSAEDLKNYDPAGISMVFGLIPISGGFAENTFCKITPNSPMFKLKKGADGSSARGKTNDTSGVCEITLLSTALANGLLSAQATLGENGPNGGDVSPLTIRDQNGSMVFFAAKAWIRKRPDVEFGNEVTERTWEIEYGESIRIDGGS